MTKSNRAIFVATTAAALLLSGRIVARTTDAVAADVKCAGINECKGHGACAGADNACKSQNACKGQGWVETKSAKECKDKGGTVLVAKK